MWSDWRQVYLASSLATDEPRLFTRQLMYKLPLCSWISDQNGGAEEKVYFSFCTKIDVRLKKFIQNFEITNRQSIFFGSLHLSPLFCSVWNCQYLAHSLYEQLKTDLCLPCFLFASAWDECAVRLLGNKSTPPPVQHFPRYLFNTREKCWGARAGSKNNTKNSWSTFPNVWNQAIF